MSTKSFRRAFQFFLTWAGGVVGQNAVGALNLARAEKWAEDRGITFEWEYDSDADSSWCQRCEHIRECGHIGRQTMQCKHVSCEHEFLGCTLKDPEGEFMESLWGIDGVTPQHRRVVEAELALEAYAQYEEQERTEQEMAKFIGQSFAL